MNRLLNLPSSNGHTNGKLRYSAQDWSGPNHGDRGGTYWVNRKTQEKVYQQQNPGGTDAAKPQEQPKGEAPGSTDESVKAAGAKYAQQARAKWGDQAHAKLSEMAAKLAGDASLEAVKKLGAVKAMLGALGEEKPTASAAPAAPESQKPVSGIPEGGYGTAKTKIPNRLHHYENGVPTKIIDHREGVKQPADEVFSQAQRPGVVRNEKGEPISLQVAKKALADDSVNNRGMAHRYIANLAKDPSPLFRQYESYAKNLVEQLGNEIDLSDEDGQARAIQAVGEFRQHADNMKTELKDWAVSLLRTKHGSEEIGAYIDTNLSDVYGKVKPIEEIMGKQIEQRFVGTNEAIDEIEEAVRTGDQETADEWADKLDDFTDEFKDAAWDVFNKHTDAIDEAVSTREQAQEDEVDALESELNDMDFDEAKVKAREYNQKATKEGIAFRMKYTPDSGEWYRDDFARRGEPERYAVGDYDGEEPERHEADAPKRKFSSTQFDIYGDMAKSILDMAASIPDAELADDGREDHPHITIKYGLHTSDSAAVAKAVREFGPVEITLGKVSIFPAKEATAQRGGDQYDVVKIDVEGERLHAMNKLISDSLECTDTHPEYKPHVTLAYVKPGDGAKYIDDDRFAGKTATFETLTFSDLESEKTPISLTGDPKRFAWDYSDEPTRYAALDIDLLRRTPGPEASAYARGVLAMLQRRPDLRREFSLVDLAYLETIARQGAERFAWDYCDEPMQFAAHDVSDEKRDESGKWTTGGNAGKTSGGKPKEKPMRGTPVFHGTTSDFDKPSAGSYWTATHDAAKVYTRGKEDGKIHVGYLSPKAKIVDIKGFNDPLVQEYFRVSGSNDLEYSHFVELVESNKFRAFLVKNKYDAVRIQEDSSSQGDANAVNHDSIVPLNDNAITHSHVTDTEGNKIEKKPEEAVDLSKIPKPQFTNHGYKRNISVQGVPEQSLLGSELKKIGATHHSGGKWTVYHDREGKEKFKKLLEKLG